MTTIPHPTPPPPPPRKPWVPPRLELVEVESVWQGQNVNPGDADSPSANIWDGDILPNCPSS